MKARIQEKITQTVCFLGLSLAVGCASGGGRLGNNPFDSHQDIQNHVQANPADLRILFFGHVAGETQPCGCGLNPKGGLDRRLNYVRQVLAEAKTSSTGLLVLDAGNSLFPSEVLHKAQEKKLKNRAIDILKSHKLMGVNVQNAGFLDLSAGLEFFRSQAKSAGIEVVSLNLVDPITNAPLFLESKTFLFGSSEEVVVVGLTEGPKRPSSDFKVLDPETSLKSFLAKQKPNSKIIVLSDLGQDKDQALASQLNRPILFVASREASSLEIPLHVGKSLIVRSQFQGQQWGDLRMSGAAGRGWWPNWYGYILGASFRDLWNARAESYRQIEAQASGPDKENELQKIRETQKEIEIYAPKNWKQSNLYGHSLVDLTVQFSQKNELTELVYKNKN